MLCYVILRARTKKESNIDKKPWSICIAQNGSIKRLGNSNIRVIKNEQKQIILYLGSPMLY